LGSTVINEKYELVKLEKLQPHPSNPRRGDMGAIQESIETNGFYGAVVVQRSTGHILAGNHRYQAAKEAGIEKLPVVWVDVDDERALRILLGDNRTSDLATNDDQALLELLKLLSESEEGLVGTGYGDDDLTACKRRRKTVPLRRRVTTRFAG